MARKTEKQPLKEILERAECEAVERTMAQTRNNVAKAAAMLGIARPSLYRIMRRHGIASPTRSNIDSPE